jgi:hypothetical protein
MMLDEHRTPRRFWTDAISTACYISNQIFLCSILYLTPFELRFGRKPSVSHLKSFGLKCFVLKHGVGVTSRRLLAPEHEDKCMDAKV